VSAESGMRIAECGEKRIAMNNQDLKKRTFAFGIRCVRLVEKLPKGMVSELFGRQLIRCATSVGANYRAAARGRSRADFISKLGIVEEECDESMYWIESLVEMNLIKLKQVDDLLKEANEILSIIISSINTARKNGKPAK